MRDLLAAPLDDLLAEARRLRRGPLVTYSPKVFVPLTTLCRDVCGYCTFARPPRRGERAYLTEDEVLAIARAGAAAGCREALFTLGDRPELRYRVAREELAAIGCETTLEYLKQRPEKIYTKTSIMIGLGETDEELEQCFKDLRNVGVDVLTLGQYLQPSQYHLRVERFCSPEKFAEYQKLAESYGFLYVASGPLVRSSYRAAEFFMKGLMEREQRAE